MIKNNKEVTLDLGIFFTEKSQNLKIAKNVFPKCFPKKLSLLGMTHSAENDEKCPAITEPIN